MKIKLLSLFVTGFLASVATVVSALPTHQSVYFSFSGGSNTPLTITLSTPLHFQATMNTAGYSLVIQDFGTSYQRYISSTVSYTINGGDASTFNKMDIRSEDVNDLTVNDLFIFNENNGAVVSGDLIDFTTGTITTDLAYYYGKPSDGYYDVFLVNNFGIIMASVVPVPEPSAYAALAGLTALVGASIYRRRKAA